MFSNLISRLKSVLQLKDSVSLWSFLCSLCFYINALAELRLWAMYLFHMSFCFKMILKVLGVIKFDTIRQYNLSLSRFL